MGPRDDLDGARAKLFEQRRARLRDDAAVALGHRAQVPGRL